MPREILRSHVGRLCAAVLADFYVTFVWRRRRCDYVCFCSSHVRMPFIHDARAPAW